MKKSQRWVGLLKEHSSDLTLMSVNFLLMALLAVFWSSVLIVVTMGTDYWYDTYVRDWAKDGGTSLLVLTVILLAPIMLGFLNFKDYKRTKRQASKLIGISGVCLFLLGVAWFFLKGSIV